MQPGVDYNGVSDQIQQFMVGRGSVSVGPLHVPSHIFALGNSHDLPSQACKQRNPTHLQQHHVQQQSSGGLQNGVQQLDLAPESPENPSPHGTNPKQKIHEVQEGLTEEDIGVGEHGDKGSEINRWPREETLALLRIRSLMDADFKDSNVKGPIWENVSRKLAELGFYRSAKKCKEKFENVNKYYKRTKDGRVSRQDGKSYRFFSELEALYSGISGKSSGNGNNGVHPGACINQSGIGANSSVLIDSLNPQTKSPMERSSETDYNRRPNMSSDIGSSDDELEDQPRDHHDDPPKNEPQELNRKKRKRKTSFSSMKFFLENMVKQMMDHQEKLQRKFLEAIEKRDQDRLVREEAWKRQEMARLNRETELRAQEHALASSREAAIVGFLQKFTGKNLKFHDPYQNNDKGAANTTSIISVIPNSQEDQNIERGNFDPHCKRWPKPEVYALIRLRSGMEHRFKESGPKVSLWEEISSGMACMGFNRSAKRCKEKWENINKYFRKTKGSMKKRPLNAKTCPYFHQLDILYRKGVLYPPSHKSNEKLENNPENLESLPDIDRDQKIMEKEAVQVNHDEDSDQLLAIIPASQVSVPPTNNHETVQHFPTYKRMKLNENPPENVIQTTDDHHAVVLNSSSTNAFSGSSNDNKNMKMADRLVKDMIEMQQSQHQKFLDEFDKRDQEQDLRDHERRHHHHHHQQQQVLKSPEVLRSQTVSQSALMALVHKLTGNYSISAPSRTEWEK